MGITYYVYGALTGATLLLFSYYNWNDPWPWNLIHSVLLLWSGIVIIINTIMVVSITSYMLAIVMMIVSYSMSIMWGIIYTLKPDRGYFYEDVDGQEMSGYFLSGTFLLVLLIIRKY